MHAAKRDEELCKQTPTKLSKKEKKRQKEAKKLGKSKKLDADKVSFWYKFRGSNGSFFDVCFRVLLI